MQSTHIDITGAAPDLESIQFVVAAMRRRLRWIGLAQWVPVIVYVCVMDLILLRLYGGTADRLSVVAGAASSVVMVGSAYARSPCYMWLAGAIATLVFMLVPGFILTDESAWLTAAWGFSLIFGLSGNHQSERQLNLLDTINPVLPEQLVHIAEWADTHLEIQEYCFGVAAVGRAHYMHCEFFAMEEWAKKPTTQADILRAPPLEAEEAALRMFAASNLGSDQSGKEGISDIINEGATQ